MEPRSQSFRSSRIRQEWTDFCAETATKNEFVRSADKNNNPPSPADFVLHDLLRIEKLLYNEDTFMKWNLWVLVISGAWLLISPWILGFSDLNLAKWNNIVLGGIVILFTLWVFSEHSSK